MRKRIEDRLERGGRRGLVRKRMVRIGRKEDRWERNRTEEMRMEDRKGRIDEGETEEEGMIGKEGEIDWER